MDNKNVVGRKGKVVAKGIIILGIIVVLIPLCLFGYYKYNVYTLKNETYDYLTNKGYEESEINKVDVVLKKGPLLSSLVEFADEPNIVYWYNDKNGEMVQIGVYEPDVVDENNLKHLED